MRFLIDENLPPLLATRLASLGHDVERVRDTQLGASDDALLSLACEEERIVITSDKGIGAPAFAGTAAPPGLTLVRLPRASKERLVERVVDAVQDRADWAGWASTVTVGRIRRRRLPR